MTPRMAIRLRYTVMGLTIGTTWFIGRNRPPFAEAIRVIIIFTILILVARALLKSRGLHIRLVPILATKICLIVAAAIVETLLGTWVTTPGIYVAIGLLLIITFGGPLFDRHLFTYEIRNRIPQEATK